MRSFTCRALVGIFGGVLLLCRSLDLSGSTGLDGRDGCLSWEPDAKPGSLETGTGFVGGCCGLNVAGGPVAVSC